MAEEARLEARLAPARTLILNILRVAEEWATAAEHLDDLMRMENPETRGLSREQHSNVMGAYELEKLQLGVKLSIATAEAWLVFKEESLLDPIRELQVAAREPDDASAPPGELTGRGVADPNIQISERTLRMMDATKRLHTAAATYLRTSLPAPPK